jgi:DNA polymerase II large subunit
MADVAYCMKCREKREFTGELVTLANGRPALQGKCPVCGTKLTKIMGMDAAKAMGWTAPA